MEQPDPPVTAALDRLAEDWIALWQSELAALAADPDLAAAWAGLLRVFASRADTHDPAPGPAPVADASRPGIAQGDAGPGGADAAALLGRIAELERRLAALEGRAGGSGADRPRPRRRRTQA